MKFLGKGLVMDAGFALERMLLRAALSTTRLP